MRIRLRRAVPRVRLFVGRSFELRRREHELLARLHERRDMQRNVRHIMLGGLHEPQHVRDRHGRERQRELRRVELHDHDVTIRKRDVHERIDLRRHVHGRVVVGLVLGQLDVRRGVPSRRVQRVVQRRSYVQPHLPRRLEAIDSTGRQVLTGKFPR